MGTITTVLPVYDKIAKQCFQRGKDGGIDTPIAVKCPRHRIPSLEWDVPVNYLDEIESIELVNEYPHTSQLVSSMIYNSGYPTLVTYDTLVDTAVNNGVAHYFLLGPYFHIYKDDRIVVRFTLDLNSGEAPSVDLIGGVTAQTAKNGYNELIFVALADAYVALRFSNTTNSDFSTDDISVVRDYKYLFHLAGNYVQNGGGAGWTNGGYDTFTSVNKDITSAIKTTAAGVAKCWNVISTGSVPTTIHVGDTMRIRVNMFFLISGTAPRLVLQNTSTGADISNTYLLIAGRVNYAYLTATVETTGFAIAFYNQDTEVSRWEAYVDEGYISVMPRTIADTPTVFHYEYQGETLSRLLPCGTWYLKMTTLLGYVYYSEWFQVDDIYPNLISELTNISYGSLSVSGTEILSAINNAVATALILSDEFSVLKDETITILLYFTHIGGEYPSIAVDNDLSISAIATLVPGLNILSFTSSENMDDAKLYIFNQTLAEWSTSEIMIMREYSEKYLTINFSNTCNLGDIIYEDGFTQTAWIESEPMEMSFPQEEKGIENGEGRFVRTFARQIKKYMARTLALPDYMAEVFHRMKLHDTVEIIDLVGDVNDVYNLEVEHEWLWDDKYYCKLDLTFDYNEAFVVGGCCNNLT